MSKIVKYFVVGIFALIVLTIVITASSGSSPERKAIKQVNSLVMDNAVKIISENPNYYFDGVATQNPNGAGMLVTDRFSQAEWVVIGGIVYAENGLAKSLTPSIEYSK